MKKPKIKGGNKSLANLVKEAQKQTGRLPNPSFPFGTFGQVKDNRYL